ncbi:selenophosphate synthase [Octadecabacter temperatus]|uniref:Selenide, water dikinase n=1 Tax=Octadecabacter temperatus TaxID=1458307 RepID=A0A0K0Y0Z0_9RHOB|nr:selenide, water dikinase SelD [Octadecabacter temperatus]AKS44595.1 Selenide, water dikinase [Octadecabacter temperatus]SIO37691.1 selenophosphate synthase [Octadecabacter temperatus]
MKQTVPFTRDLVLVGGGHTHALVLRSWGMNPLPGVRLTVINPGPTAPYSGMLPGFVAGHYTRDELDIDLVKLARFAGARIIVGKAVAIDPIAKTISVPDRPDIAYDVAVIDVGITSEMPTLAGFAEHGIPAKPLGVFASRWDAYRANATTPKVAVIGGGVAGAELAMAMAYALRDQAPEVSLIDRGEVLDGFNEPTRNRLLAALEELNVSLVEHAEVAEVLPNAVRLTDGTLVPSDFTTGAAGARPHDWVADIGLDLQEGSLVVGPTLQTSDPDVFAVGDCAYLSHDPRPKAGVFAVREAPYLFDNLRARLSDGKMRNYHPQKDYLKLISLGGKEALAEKLGTARRSTLLWKWKNHIDRTFMNQFEKLPQMEPELPLRVAQGVKDALGDTPLCGGCGAKVGRGALQGALKTLPETGRNDIVPLVGDDAALLKTGGALQVFTTDHLSAVTDDPVLMAKITAIHALGDIWAMGADPQAAVLSLTLPRMSADLQQRTVTEVTQTISENLGGAALVGGHTTMGDSMTIGLSLTGLCSADPVTLAGAQVGDVLVLTKPIGSGTILAAEMRRLARGADVLACYKSMTQSNEDFARALKDAHAMTDVTGFGLAGHLAGMCETSGVGATVRLDNVPLLDGALSLAESGVRSSLFPDNRNDTRITAPDTARSALMFDPQTAGGLLAALPRDQAVAITKKFPNVGISIIGEITEGRGVTFS